MAKGDMYPHDMELHSGKWRVTKRIPKECARHYEKSVFRLSTGCADKREASVKAWQ
jgi:hypothetical protein